MRKLRRKEILQDKRDRVKMGLAPPDPPKGIAPFVMLYLAGMTNEIVL